MGQKAIKTDRLRGRTRPSSLARQDVWVDVEIEHCLSLMVPRASRKKIVARRGSSSSPGHMRRGEQVRCSRCARKTASQTSYSIETCLIKRKARDNTDGWSVTVCHSGVGKTL